MMFQNYVTLLPEFLLSLSLIVLLLVDKYRSNKTPKTFFTISKVFILLSLLFTLVFYNRSSFSGYLENNEFTTLFKMIIYLLSLAWFYLSCKWFLNKDFSSLSFYMIVMTELLCFSFAISANNLLILLIALELGFILNLFLIRLGDYEIVSPILKRYVISIIVLALMFAAGTYILYQDVGSLSYSNIDEFLSDGHRITFRHYIASALIIVAILYMMGIAPFHFWSADVLGTAILPVSGYLTLIPIFAYFACFVDLTVNAFPAVYPLLKAPLVFFAVLSILIGAVGANSENNMRKLFSYSTTYHLGVVLLCLLAFDNNSLLSSFVYLVTYTLAMTGLYTAFFGFKSKGEYLVNLSEISGISEVKPFISAACLVFMISLIGIPPMLGFLGKLSVMNHLIIEGNYIWIGVISLALLMLTVAYLRVIKIIYFDERKNNFDRADKGVYICLMINIVLVLISLFNPKYLMLDVERMLVTIF